MLRLKLLDKVWEVEAEIKAYLKGLRFGVEGADPQLEDVLRIFEIWQNETMHIPREVRFEKNCEIAEPIFNRLNAQVEWDFRDFRILSRVVCDTRSFKDAYALIETALKKLEKFADYDDYVGIKLAIHMAALLRFQRAKHIDLYDVTDEEGFDMLIEMFVKHYDEIVKMCYDGGFINFLSVAKIRYGMFFEKRNLVKEDLEELERYKEYEIARLIRKEAIEHDIGLCRSVKKLFYNEKLGRKIRNFRIGNKMTIGELARIVEVDITKMESIEAGQREVSMQLGFKLADVLNVPVEVFKEESELGLFK